MHVTLEDAQERTHSPHIQTETCSPILIHTSATTATNYSHSVLFLYKPFFFSSNLFEVVSSHSLLCLTVLKKGSFKKKSNSLILREHSLGSFRFCSTLTSALFAQPLQKNLNESSLHPPQLYTARFINLHKKSVLAIQVAAWLLQ